METNDKVYTVVNDLTPAFPVHPGGILKEELEARGIKKKDFAAQIGIQATHLSAIIHGKRDITPAVAAKLERGLPGISAGLWLGLQQDYNLDVERCKHKTSLFVCGYKPKCTEPALALAEPKAEYTGLITVTVSIPESDRELLEMLARRLGWAIQYSRECAQHY